MPYAPIGEPLERLTQNDEIAEQRAEDEQEHRDRERRDEIHFQALLGLSAGRKNAEDLPEDDRRARDDRCPEGYLKRAANASKGVAVLLESLGEEPEIGANRRPAPPALPEHADGTSNTTTIRRMRSLPRWSKRGIRAGPIGIAYSPFSSLAGASAAASLPLRSDVGCRARRSCISRSPRRVPRSQRPHRQLPAGLGLQPPCEQHARGRSALRLRSFRFASFAAFTVDVAAFFTRSSHPTPAALPIFRSASSGFLNGSSASGSKIFFLDDLVYLILGAVELRDGLAKRLAMAEACRDRRYGN